MIIPLDLGKDSYDIVLQRGAIENIDKYIALPEDSKALIVTDSGVPCRYSEAVASKYKNSFIYTFPQGEKSKNFDTYRLICQELLDKGFTRNDAVIAVGGGVTGDMAGFAAATYMRGIAFYNVPTTVLSQVDSSIGGKTAIDLGKIKNIIGAFYQPKKVIIDPDVLLSLPERQIKNGLSESIKMGLTFSSELFDIFLEKDYMKHIEKIIELSLRVKKYVVEQDEKEAGLRKALNFGHTIGHGIEATVEYEELYHGECVALGMIPMCGEKVKNELITALSNVGLPTEYTYDKEKVFNALCHDKKASGTEITVIMCEEKAAFIMKNMKASELYEMI